MPDVKVVVPELPIIQNRSWRVGKKWFMSYRVRAIVCLFAVLLYKEFNLWSLQYRQSKLTESCQSIP